MVTHQQCATLLWNMVQVFMAHSVQRMSEDPHQKANGKNRHL
ncbi:Uncharacterised protein [Vibrio cholerae]|uniref:Uncharacterized protein n=1 Tax=Vibrio cholerae TaxID=666 RepID=A0A655P8E9_VIBCL|nr:Uncharacterised protein [Vibrio cholerae]CRZ96951.1 Uncharacterised protein [Vibrio cholerae]CSC80371.1 Uncharacterised protein [Vibrio cholerae]